MGVYHENRVEALFQNLIEEGYSFKEAQEIVEEETEGDTILSDYEEEA